MKFAIALLLVALIVPASFAAGPKVCSPIGNGFPADTAYIQNKDGSMSIGVPEGWTMLQNLNGKWSHTTVAAVTCRCTTGTGCSPGAFNGQVACVMTSCSACTKSGGGALALYPVRDEDIGVRFADKSELGKLPSVDHELLSAPEVQASIQEFKNTLGVPANAPEDFYAAVKIYGRLAAIGLPKTIKMPRAGSAIGDAFMGLAAINMVTYPSIAAITCKCNVGASCPKEGNVIIGVYWCNASNCSSCTMSGV
ncbi:hypothetical protein [Thermomonas alba]|uniref:hypothetical protein n=1 Tax=Thermomonas alba TaxID=2888525 RepID=UPI001F03D91B|nr:hypothetical protein [Thermomonas alba]